MELDVKLAPQCMEVGSAGLHTAAAASAGGVVKTSIVSGASVSLFQNMWTFGIGSGLRCFCLPEVTPLKERKRPL